MSDLVGNPEDLFSQNEAQLYMEQDIVKELPHLQNDWAMLPTLEGVTSVSIVCINNDRFEIVSPSPSTSQSMLFSRYCPASRLVFTCKHVFPPSIRLALYTKCSIRVIFVRFFFQTIMNFTNTETCKHAGINDHVILNKSSLFFDKNPQLTNKKRA